MSAGMRRDSTVAAKPEEATPEMLSSSVSKASGVFGGGEELARAGDLDAAAVLRVRALEIEVQEGKSAVGQNACVDVLAVLPA